MRTFPTHTALTILTTGALSLAWRLSPGPLPPPKPPSSPTVSTPAPVAAAALTKPVVPPPLLDDSDGALDGFYRALTRTERREPGAVTRIVHYGDSPTSADLITGDVRAALQSRFGDAGHGFILVSKPWAWYGHDAVKLSGSNWKAVPASRFERHDGLFGLGGVSFTGAAGATSRITLERAGYSHFELWFLRQPGGGAVTLHGDGAPLGEVDTAGDTPTAGFAAFDSPAPATSLELRVTRGTVRAFGITAEDAGPGVVYDSLGLNGASITVMTRMFQQAHWSEQLQHRDPSLVIVNYGSNEADFAGYVDKDYAKELREAIRRIRTALPDTPVLIMSPMDRGYKSPGGEIETMPTIPRIVDIQRRVARETGCGFFDTFHAMGGEGTMAQWYAAHPRLVSADFIHPYPAGGKLVAQAFVREILGGLSRYQERTRIVVPEP
jgi:lysophospholipase L1-like esterase